MSSQHEAKAKGNGANNLHGVKGLSKERPWLLPSVRVPTVIVKRNLARSR